MTTTQEAWGDFGSKLESLGLKLKLHFEQELSEEGAAEGGVRERLEQLGESIEGVFEAIGNAADDDAVKSDAKEAAAMLLDALGTTLTGARDALRRS